MFIFIRSIGVCLRLPDAKCVPSNNFQHCVLQGILENPEDIGDYLNKKGVSVIFLLRRKTLRRLISVLANDYDKDAKQLNGTHKSC